MRPAEKNGPNVQPEVSFLRLALCSHLHVSSFVQGDSDFDIKSASLKLDADMLAQAKVNYRVEFPVKEAAAPSQGFAAAASDNFGSKLNKGANRSKAKRSHVDDVPSSNKRQKVSHKRWSNKSWKKC